MLDPIKIVLLVFTALMIVAASVFCVRMKSSRLSSIGLVSIVSLFFATLFFYYGYSDAPEIALAGGGEVTIEVFGSYKEPGYTAEFNGIDVTNEVRVSGDVDTDKTGDYTVKYTVNFLFGHAVKRRTVHVVDTKPPEIELLGGEETWMIYDPDEIDTGNFTAYDNYDGDITDKAVVSTLRNGDCITVSYLVADSSGNEAHATRTFEVGHLGIPKINLNGYSTITLRTGSAYEEQGATAADSAGRDITERIVVSGRVDTGNPGIYRITYSVTDSQNNESAVMRIVNVVSEDYARGNMVYLTFDDGPSRKNTPRILDVLKKHSVKATFFIINFSDGDSDIIRRILDEGHTLGIHGYSHRYKEIYASEEAFMKNITRLGKRVYDISGAKVKFIRFPGGSSNVVSAFNPGIMTRLTKKVLEEGYVYYDWNVESGDASVKAADKDVIVGNVINGLKPGRDNVVLMHDSKEKTTTVEALPEIIEYCRSQGYDFAPITDVTEPVIHKVKN